MRHFTYNDFKVEYPEILIFTADTTQVTVSHTPFDTPTPFGAVIRVANPSGASRTIRHITTFSNYIVFDITDTILSIYERTNAYWNVSVELVEGGVSVKSMFFSVRVLDGNSFTNRSHSVNTTINVYDEEQLSAVDIFVPGNSSLRIGGATVNVETGVNTIDFTPYITDCGTYRLSILSDDNPPFVRIDDFLNATKSGGTIIMTGEVGTPAYSFDGGDVWGQEFHYPIVHTINYDCGCENRFKYVMLRYINADGCYRYLNGKLLMESNESAFSPYRYPNPVFSNIVSNYVNSTARVLKIGFVGIDRDCYIQDILYSPELKFRNYAGIWYDCALKTDTFDYNGDNDRDDYEIEIYVNI